MSYVTKLIPTELVERFWPFALPYVKRALDKAAGELTAESIHEACARGGMGLWLVSDGPRVVGALTTWVIDYPAGRHCCIVTVAGSHFSEWMELAQTTIETWAKGVGCIRMASWVRRGFVPKLETLGYKHKYSVVMKDIDHG